MHGKEREGRNRVVVWRSPHRGADAQTRAEHHEHFYVLNDEVTLADDMRGRTYFIAHSERDLRTLTNVFEAVGYCVRSGRMCS